MKMNHKYQSREGNADLEKEYLEFDRTFNFHNISYRFQPQLIYERLRIGMEINDELIQLKEKIQQYSEKHERENEKKINNILTWLTIFTLVSIANDITSFITTFIDGKTPQAIPWSALGVVAVIIVWILYKFNRTKK